MGLHWADRGRGFVWLNWQRYAISGDLGPGSWGTDCTLCCFANNLIVMGHGVDILFEPKEGIWKSGEGIVQCLESMGKFGLEWREGNRGAIHDC